MEFVLFILFILFLFLFDRKDSSSKKRNKTTNVDIHEALKRLDELKKNQKESNWDSKYYHKKTNAHYPEFKFSEQGWSLSKVYLPERNTEEYIDLETGDKYNLEGLDYLGNKKPELKDKTLKKLKRHIKVTPKKVIKNIPQVEISKSKKNMWKSIDPFLDYARVEKFYHFTDKRNLKSIIDNAGLYTWYGLKNKNIHGHISSNAMSQSLDKRKGLENYVRLSFSDYHPMSSVVKSQNDTELIWLEIDRTVATFEDTLFSNMNATDNNVTISGDFEFLKKLDFNIFKERYNNLTDIEKKYYQSEILIKDFLPLEYITNLEELKERYL